MKERLCNSDFSLLRMPLVSTVKINLNFQKAYWLVSQYLDRVMLCLEPFDFNDFSLKMKKYLIFPNSHFGLKT